jgi:hypothetical protein
VQVRSVALIAAVGTAVAARCAGKTDAVDDDEALLGYSVLGGSINQSSTGAKGKSSSSGHVHGDGMNAAKGAFVRCARF